MQVRDAQPANDATDATDVAPLRVLVVDADDRVRASLAGLLGTRDDVEVVGTAGDPIQAEQLMATVAAEVLIIDPRLPDLADGIALIGRVRAGGMPASAVRIVAMGWGDAPEPAATHAGVDGWIRKTFRPDQLVAAICAAAASEAVEPPPEPDLTDQTPRTMSGPGFLL